MADTVSESAEPSPRRAAPGAMVLAAGGLTAAFGAAACCALPLLLTGAGIGSAWLGGIGLIAGPHRAWLLGIATALLLAGALLLGREHRTARTCSAGGVCARPTYRLATLVALLVGATLLLLGYVYG